MRPLSPVLSFLAERSSIGLVNRRLTDSWDHTGQEPKLDRLISIDWSDREGMQPLIDLQILVDKFAAALTDLNLEGDEQEEYGTMLLRPQKIETVEPSEKK